MSVRILRPALLVLGAAHLALGVYMAIAPGSFFRVIAGFGVRNDHFVRDVSTYNLAYGAVLLVAAGRRSWRLPVLAFGALQYVLHAVNHLLDIGKAHPKSSGPLDFVLIGLTGVVLILLVRLAAIERRDGASDEGVAEGG
jgi:hypothetical protein